MGYWIAALTLIVFGTAGLMTIGLQFLIVGLMMLMLGRVRHLPRIFWPPLLGAVSFSVASLSIEPFYCAASSSTNGASTATSCSSLIGIPWPAVPSGVADLGTDLTITYSVSLAIALGALILVAAWQARNRTSHAAAR
jgi:hypothetical protein